MAMVGVYWDFLSNALCLLWWILVDVVGLLILFGLVCYDEVVLGYVDYVLCFIVSRI